MTNEFFPAIGSVAQKTDDLPDDEETTQTPEQNPELGDEDRPLQEVESLCMSCGEQVRSD
jgi:zinc finger protein